ncbi:hypothetical protein ACVIGB_000778 [Bradyrhizobium sp. USDA 4341]
MKRYAVRMSIEGIDVTANGEEEAIRNCDEDVRSCVGDWNYTVTDVSETDEPLTQELDDITYLGSSVEEPGEEGEEDTWTMEGEIEVVVEANNKDEAAEKAKILPKALRYPVDEEGRTLHRYAVTLKAPMNITADDEDEAVRNCDDDAREFVVQNDHLEVASIEEVDPDDVSLTKSVDDIEFLPSEVARSAAEGSADWLMNGVYKVVVDAANPTEAGAAAKKFPKSFDFEAAPSPAM